MTIVSTYTTQLLVLGMLNNMDKLKKLKFNEISILLLVCIIVLAMGAFLFVDRALISIEEERRVNLQTQQLQEEIDQGSESIVTPVTPEIYMEVTKGVVPPSGYLLRLWEDEKGLADRLEAIQGQPKPYPIEGD